MISFDRRGVRPLIPVAFFLLFGVFRVEIEQQCRNAKDFHRPLFPVTLQPELSKNT